jgi:hypothetical protein
MFILTSYPHSPNTLKLDMQRSTVGRLQLIASKEDGTALTWVFRNVTNSYKAHGARATYYIREA